jgi:hypothetical protein
MNATREWRNDRKRELENVQEGLRGDTKDESLGIEGSRIDESS